MSFFDEDPLEDLVGDVVRWLVRPQGAPPAGTVHDADLVAGSGSKRRWKDPPFRWPPGLADRRLVLVSASGGIDSNAAAILVRRRWPDAMVVLTRADTGWEPEDTPAVLQALSRAIAAPLITLKPRRDLFDLIRHKKITPVPARKAVWCTGELKANPLDRLHKFLTLGRRNPLDVHVVGYLPHENKRWERFERNRERHPIPATTIYPLREEGVDKDAAIELIRQAGVPFSSTYTEGIERHGCIPCKWWGPREWKMLWLTDPGRFEESADLEEELIRTHGWQVNRTWLQEGTHQGTLREHLARWQQEGLPPLAELRGAGSFVHLDSLKSRGRSNRRWSMPLPGVQYRAGRSLITVRDVDLQEQEVTVLNPHEAPLVLSMQEWARLAPSPNRAGRAARTTAGDVQRGRSWLRSQLVEVSADEPPPDVVAHRQRMFKGLSSNDRVLRAQEFQRTGLRPARLAAAQRLRSVAESRLYHRVGKGRYGLAVRQPKSLPPSDRAFWEGALSEAMAEIQRWDAIEDGEQSALRAWQDQWEWREFKAWKVRRGR